MAHRDVEVRTSVREFVSGTKINIGPSVAINNGPIFRIGSRPFVALVFDESLDDLNRMRFVRRIAEDICRAPAKRALFAFRSLLRLYGRDRFARALGRRAYAAKLSRASR